MPGKARRFISSEAEPRRTRGPALCLMSQSNTQNSDDLDSLTPQGRSPKA